MCKEDVSPCQNESAANVPTNELAPNIAALSFSENPRYCKCS